MIEEDVQALPKQPAKRGRKKKEVVESEQEPKIKKKRGRKAALKFFSSSIRKKIPMSINTNSSNNIILHLDVPEQDQPGSDNENTEMTGPDNTLSLLGFADESANYSNVHLQTKSEQGQEYNKVSVPNLEGQSQKLDNKSSQKIQKGYIQLFESMDTSKKWPEKTDLHCWWCCHGFDTVPIGLPMDYRYVRDHDQYLFKVKGNFCSIPCVYTWYNNSKYIKNPTILSLIKFLNRKITGMNTLNEAPPRETLKIFGGDLSIEEFRKKSNSGNIFKMINYPMIIIKEFIEEIDLTNLKIQNERQEMESIPIRCKTIGVKKGMENLIANAKTRMTTKNESTVSTENTIDKFLKMKLT